MCNIILLVILAGVIYYYYVYIYQKREKFSEKVPESNGCFSLEQYDMDVQMRNCGVYFIDTQKETECDRYYQYYDMTDVQIDMALAEASQKGNTELQNKLMEIKQYLYTNNFNKCKISYDNWKEISSYYDNNYQEETKSYVYPKKNVNDVDHTNFNLWNSCFTRSSNLNTISYNDSVVAACTTPINNIRDINEKDNEYISMSFDPNINYQNIYKSICDIAGNKDKTLNMQGKTFMVLHCEYNSGVSLKVKDISFVRYNANRFDVVVMNNSMQNKFNDMFKLTYDKNMKKIIYGPRRMNMGTHLLNYDLCKNIKSSEFRNVQFTFKDFNAVDEIVDIDLSVVPDLVDSFDDNISAEDKDNQDLMSSLTNQLAQKIQEDTDEIKKNKEAILEEIKELLEKMTEDGKKVHTQNTAFGNYVAAVLKSRKETDGSFTTYMQAVQELKQAIDTEFNRQKAFIGTEISASENSVRQQFNNHLSRENAKCAGLCNEVNTKLDDEYKLTVNTLTQMYQDVTTSIRNQFLKGVYFNVNLYANGAITKYSPKTENEFTCMLLNTNISDNYVGIANTQNNNFYHDLGNRVSEKLYATFEFSGNIFLDQGYYYFYVDLIEEECADVFIGYPDKNNKDAMIFKNVAQYYYVNPADNFDIRTRKDAGVAAATMRDPKNKTTRYPVYIDGEFNNGYYAFYARTLRGISAINNNYFNIKYIKVTNPGGSYYDVFNSATFEYKAASTVTSSGVSRNVKDLLYVYKDLTDMTRISAYYLSLNKNKIQKSTAIKENSENKFLAYWWDFDGTLESKVGNAKFQVNTENNSDYMYDTKNIKYNESSLKMQSKASQDSFKLEAEIVLPTTFTFSFWAYTSGCCSMIASIGDDLYINVQKSVENKDIVYVNQFSQNTSKNEKYSGTCESTSCKTYQRGEYSCKDRNNIGDNYMFGEIDYSSLTCAYRDTTHCETSSYTCIKERTVHTVVNVVQSEFNKWNHYVLTYNTESQTLKFFYNGEFKFEKTRFDYAAGHVPLRLFKTSTNNTTVIYNDIRIYNKELTPYENYSVYYDDTCLKNTEINPDPGLRKLNPKFYITCPKMPKLTELPAKTTVTLTYIPLKIPLIRDINAYGMSYVPIYTQEKGNLANFYNMDALIDELDKLRSINIEDYDCIIKAEKQMLTNSVTQESIDNKQELVKRLQDQIDKNKLKISKLDTIYNAINNFNKYYDFTKIKELVNSGIVFNHNTEMFNKYITSVFKNLKDGYHYIYLEFLAST